MFGRIKDELRTVVIIAIAMALPIAVYAKVSSDDLTQRHASAVKVRALAAETTRAADKATCLYVNDTRRANIDFWEDLIASFPNSKPESVAIVREKLLKRFAPRDCSKPLPLAGP